MNEKHFWASLTQTHSKYLGTVQSVFALSELNSNEKKNIIVDTHIHTDKHRHTLWAHQCDLLQRYSQTCTHIHYQSGLVLFNMCMCGGARQLCVAMLLSFTRCVSVDSGLRMCWCVFLVFLLLRFSGTLVHGLSIVTPAQLLSIAPSLSVLYELMNANACIV